MTNKVVARFLFYTQGSPSYGNSKGVKLKVIMKKIILPSLRLVYGDQAFSDVAKNGTIFIRNLC